MKLPAMQQHLRASKAARVSGFTLIEVLVVVAIAAVLAGIAYPSFHAQLLKARRIDALAALMQAQLAQERWRAHSAHYGSQAQIGMPATSSAGHYALQVTVHTSDSYALSATATGGQGRDAACRHLQLRASGADLVYASGPDATAANAAAANRQCWGM
jgi:type IV pilus assembly protein PilE